MSLEHIVTILVQFGLPTLLLFGAVWYFVRERAAWDLESKKRQEVWDAERKDLYGQITEGANLRVEDAREYTSALAKNNESSGRSTEMVNKLVADFSNFRDYDRERERREVERERDREMRVTGSHQPVDVTKRRP